MLCGAAWGCLHSFTGLLMGLLVAHNRFHHNCCDEKKPPTLDEVKAKSIENANKRKRSRFNKGNVKQQQLQSSSRSSPDTSTQQGK